MGTRNILILAKKDSPWAPFLREFFEDTTAKLHIAHDAQHAASVLDSLVRDMAFIDTSLLTPALVQKIKVLKQSHPELRLFQAGPKSKNSDGLAFDDVFPELQPLSLFQKRFVQHLVYPDKIRVLVIDDEAEIGDMVRDFLENRVHPTFDVTYTNDGKKGMQSLIKKHHDVVILDVKMPIKDGREIYREITAQKIPVPVIIFFDAISGEEIVEIHEIGRPAIVEKGCAQSAMPEMMALIKKMYYFRETA